MIFIDIEYCSFCILFYIVGGNVGMEHNRAVHLTDERKRNNIDISNG